MTGLRRGDSIALPSSHVVDLIFGLTLMGLGWVEIWLTPDIEPPVVLIASTLITGSVVLRRRAPLLGVAISATALATQSVLVPVPPAPFAPYVAFLVQTYSVGAYSPRLRDVFGGGLALVAAWVTTALETRSEIADYAFVSLLVGGSWLAGWGLRGRRAAVSALEQKAEEDERERDLKTQAAVTDERARIARELHDIVSHSISLIAVQAQAVRRRLGPEQEREADDLRSIETTARQAMAEMRRLFGVLRVDHDRVSLAPQPGLGQLGRLLDQTQAAGMAVEYRVEGEPAALPPGIDLLAYRVVQEALTNTLKHAGLAHSTVVVRYEDNHLEVQVDDDGAGIDFSQSDGGQGLIGMRERVSLYRGELETGDRPGGGYRVRARIPIGMDVQ